MKVTENAAGRTHTTGQAMGKIQLILQGGKSIDDFLPEERL
jgi:hypothetical protein